MLPTLGSPTRSLDEIYDRLGFLPFAAEFKYDGQRAQIHAYRADKADKALVKIFSRHLEDMTDKVRVQLLAVGSFAISPSRIIHSAALLHAVPGCRFIGGRFI